MQPRILDVGQCSPDHANISRLLRQAFDARVDEAATAREAFEMVGREPYDLILINRILDEDGASGIELIRDLKASENSDTLPVMLVSNYDDAQREAVRYGAIPGFGKAALQDVAILDRIRVALGGE